MNDYVSVIISHYSKADDFGEVRARGNCLTRSEMLRLCLDSLAENTDYPAEIIVIDNGGNPDDSNYILDWVRKGLVNIYIRNKNNMHFGWAWNQGIKLATSEIICLTCNDIIFHKGWLSKTMEVWLKHRQNPKLKLLATPFIAKDKLKHKNPRGILRDGSRLNSMAGSNCMILTKQIYFDVEPMTTHHIAGSHWHRRMNKKGYLVVAPPIDYAEHIAHKSGTNLKQHIKVIEKLYPEGEADFTFPYYK